jgi:hypothetical protein
MRVELGNLVYRNLKLTISKVSGHKLQQTFFHGGEDRRSLFAKSVEKILHGTQEILHDTGICGQCFRMKHHVARHKLSKHPDEFKANMT